MGESCADKAGGRGSGQLGGGPGNGGVCIERDPDRAREADVIEVGDFVLEVGDASALDETGGTWEGWHGEVGDGREHADAELSVSEGTWGVTPMAG